MESKIKTQLPRNSRMAQPILSQAAGAQLTCPAPAKLNLFLHVVGRRPDGYHLLQTLFRFIDLHDTLHFSLREDGVIRRTNALEGIPEAQDLCMQAARLLQSETSCSLGVDITIEKHIPMGWRAGWRKLGCGHHQILESLGIIQNNKVVTLNTISFTAPLNKK